MVARHGSLSLQLRFRHVRIMLMRPLLTILTLALLVICTAPVHADWPTVMGPDQTGVSHEKDIARSWPPGGPPVLWTVQVGPGFGGPAIRDGEVIILDRVEDERDVLRCFDFQTGAELWRWDHEVPGHLPYKGSRSVPTVGPQRVFAVGAFGNVYCVDRQTHQLQWQLDLLEQYPRDPHHFGYAQSPLLYEGHVVIAPLTDTVGLAALDSETGCVRWRSGPIGTKSYTSPTLREIDGVRCIIFITDQQISGIDPDTGELLWKFTEYNPPQQAALPTCIGQDRIFATAFDGAGSVMIRITRDGDAFSIEEAFRLKDHGAQLHAALFYEDHLYGKYFTKNEKGTLVSRLMCHDLDGQVQWDQGEPDHLERGGFIIVDDLLVILDDKTGELVLAEARADQYVEVARAKVLELKEPYALCPLAFTGGRLVVRDQNQMKCLDLKCIGQGEPPRTIPTE